MSEKLERALLLTGMMNEKFVKMIKSGEVNEAYIAEAFNNFREAQNPAKRKVEVEYVLGIMFSEDEKKVLTIWKNRPSWQAGKLNGIGGKIEAGESPLEAMHREFIEETGFIAKHYIIEVEDDSGPMSAFDEPVMPDWKLIGTRGRPALFDNQPGSYRMHIFACHFDTHVCDVTNEPAWSDARGEYFIECEERIDQSETVINLPLNLEILKKRGVPGFAWTADIAMAALRENFMIEVVDPVDMDHVQ